MAALSQQDREWIKAIAKEIAHEVIAELLEAHIDACPHGKLLGRAKAMMVGFGIGAVAFGGGIGFTLAKLMAAL